ncbi:MAG: hypothetical protein JRD05_00680 [Deltaproteobacteria bacterium]|nr:hypothetical protein [Deltaproteobacteria bacterium]
MDPKTPEQIAKEKAAAEKAAAEKAAAEKGLKGQALIDKACEEYGIAPEYVFASRVDGNTAIVLTNGGSRVRYKAGDKVEKLGDIAVTGINPALKKRKVIAGKKKG